MCTCASKQISSHSPNSPMAKYMYMYVRTTCKTQSWLYKWVPNSHLCHLCYMYMYIHVYTNFILGLFVYTEALFNIGYHHSKWLTSYFEVEEPLQLQYMHPVLYVLCYVCMATPVGNVSCTSVITTPVGNVSCIN